MSVSVVSFLGLSKGRQEEWATMTGDHDDQVAMQRQMAAMRRQIAEYNRITKVELERAAAYRAQNKVLKAKIERAAQQAQIEDMRSTS